MRKNTPYQKELVLEIEMLEEREVMSLKPEQIGPVPSENARLAKIVFSASCTFMKMRDELRTLYQVLIGPRDSKKIDLSLFFRFPKGAHDAYISIRMPFRQNEMRVIAGNGEQGS